MPGDFSILMRFAMPGWVFVMTLALPYVMGKPVPQIAPTLLDYVKSPGAAAFFIVAIVPLGYVIQQIYLACYWLNGGYFWAHIDLDRITTWRQYNGTRQGFRDEWQQLESDWYKLMVSSSMKDHDLIQTRLARLLDVYHAHGAIFAAIVLALVAQGYHDMASGSLTNPIWPYWVTIALTVLAIQLNRVYVSRNVTSFMGDMIAEMSQYADSTEQRLEVGA